MCIKKIQWLKYLWVYVLLLKTNDDLIIIVYERFNDNNSNYYLVSGNMILV